jgi:hypothetical protein
MNIEQQYYGHFSVFSQFVQVLELPSDSGDELSDTSKTTVKKLKGKTKVKVA